MGDYDELGDCADNAADAARLRHLTLVWDLVLLDTMSCDLSFDNSIYIQ